MSVELLRRCIQHEGSIPSISTNRNFQNFLSQTEALPRGTRQNPTARQTKWKRIYPKVRGSFQSFGQMTWFQENCRSPTVFRLYSRLKSTPARVGANSFPFVQNLPNRSQKKLFGSRVPPFSPNNFPWEYLRQYRRKRACPVSLAYRKVLILDFGRTIAMSGQKKCWNK